MRLATRSSLLLSTFLFACSGTSVGTSVDDAATKDKGDAGGKAGTDSGETADGATADDTGTPGTDAASCGSAVSTAGVECSYAYDAFNSGASVMAQSTASWSCSDTLRTLTANGIPDHATGTFPNANCPNAITTQTVSASMTLAPVATTTATKLEIVGYAFNGVKFDPSTAGACAVDGGTTTCSLIGDDGSWNIEALGQSSFNFGVDSSNAHVQPTGTYHYHGMPNGFIANLGKGEAMTLVGYALDGFPVYARYGFKTASDATSGVKVMTSSYALKTTPDSGRPSTETYPMGAFTQDYEYEAGSGDLDECNGRTGVTPEFPCGTYHYYITDTYPYIQRCVKGTPMMPAGGPPDGGGMQGGPPPDGGMPPMGGP